MKTQGKIKKLIKEYLEEAKMMQLATCSNDQPWVCNIWFAADEDLNIYWFSAETWRHSKEVLQNPKVAAAIVLPQTPKDKPRGIQLQGMAEVLVKQEGIDKAISVYQDRIFPKKLIDELMEDEETPHKFYKIKPSQIVLFDAVNFGETWRQEYNL